MALHFQPKQQRKGRGILGRRDLGGIRGGPVVRRDRADGPDCSVISLPFRFAPPHGQNMRKAERRLPHPPQRHLAVFFGSNLLEFTTTGFWKEAHHNEWRRKSQHHHPRNRVPVRTHYPI